MRILVLKAFGVRKKAVLLMAVAGMILLSGPAGAETVTAAVASNFLVPFKTLAHAFEKQTGHRVRTVSGSTGKLYAQIVHGAPYDIFLAADARRPRLLERDGKTVPASRVVYARGRLVLWSMDTQLVKEDGKRTLEAGRFKHLALANPQTAPYGRAAKTVLARLGLWKRLAPRIVRGENIGQTYHFVATGNAELGFVAASQVLRSGAFAQGNGWRVPATLHDPIVQEMVLLKPAEKNNAARALHKFLQGPAARKIIESYSYTTGEATR